MGDHPVARLGDKTLLQFAETPAMDRLAAEGRCGILDTIPEGFEPGSEVANTAILGYDLKEVYQGRGPLEAASIGYDMDIEDVALRCNIITVGEDGTIVNHHGGHLTTAEGTELTNYLQEHLGSEYVKFIPGTQYRQLLVIFGGYKYVECAPPHDHPGEKIADLMPHPKALFPMEVRMMTNRQTAALLSDLIMKSQALLAEHPINKGRRVKANSIWPWSPGYRPAMKTLPQMFPQIRSGAVITAVDLIRGIGIYAGLTPIEVEGATGMADTNYEGKSQAAIEALRNHDFVFLHIEAPDEAGHDGDLDLKLRTITDIDSKVVDPILRELRTWDEPVCVALLPDHATPVEERVHRAEPVPFVIWHNGMEPDSVTEYDEVSCRAGAYGHLHLSEFMKTFMNINHNSLFQTPNS